LPLALSCKIDFLALNQALLQGVFIVKLFIILPRNSLMSDNKDVKTILILAANPTSTSRLRLDEEVREIEEGLRRGNVRDRFQVEQKWAVRSRDFYRAILDTQPQIVHFCGHGSGEDGLVLESDTGQVELLKADELASMFRLFATESVECVVLNACYSPIASRGDLQIC
jgi:CHAT domain